ncbi:unnamed protein product, partial [Iphiclides podalirius]
MADAVQIFEQTQTIEVQRFESRHRIYNDLKNEISDEIQAGAKVTITTKPQSPRQKFVTDEMGEVASDELKKKWQEKNTGYVREVAEAEKLSPSMERYWLRRADEAKREEFYKADHPYFGAYVRCIPIGVPCWASVCSAANRLQPIGDPQRSGVASHSNLCAKRTAEGSSCVGELVSRAKPTAPPSAPPGSPCPPPAAYPPARAASGEGARRVTLLVPSAANVRPAGGRPTHERDRVATRTVRSRPLLRTVSLARFACVADCLSTNLTITSPWVRKVFGCRRTRHVDATGKSHVSTSFCHN